MRSIRSLFSGVMGSVVCTILCFCLAACGGGGSVSNGASGSNSGGGGNSGSSGGGGSAPPQLANNRTVFVRTDDIPSSAVYDSVHKLIFAAEPNLGLVDAISVPSGQMMARIAVPGVLILSLSPDQTRILASTKTQQIAWIDTSLVRVVEWQILPQINEPISGGPQYWVPYDPSFFVDGPYLFDPVYLGSPAILSNGKVLLFGKENGFLVKLIQWDPVANTVTPITQNAPAGGGMVSSADGTKVFLMAGPEIYDTATGNITPSPTPSFIDMAAVNSDGSQFAFSTGTGIMFIDGKFNVVGQVTFPGDDLPRPTNIVYSSDGTLVYLVTPGLTPIITTVDAKAFKILGNAPAYYDLLNAEVPLAADNTGLIFGSTLGGGLVLDDATFFQTLSPAQGLPPNGEIRPLEGMQQGGTTVAVSLPSNVVPDIWFGSQLSSSEVLNFTGPQAIAPPAASPSVVNIKIVQPNGTMDMLPQAFTYGSIPILGAPSAGSPTGGVIANVFGFGFSADTGGALQQVTIGGNAANVVSSGFASSGVPYQGLTVKVPPGLPGPADIVVTSPTGTATFPKGFHYLNSVTDYATADTLQALLYDETRQQLYLSAGDHIDVFSLASETFETPIIPPTLGGSRQFTCMALTPGDTKLLVGNFTDSSIAIINPDNPTSASVVSVTHPTPPSLGYPLGPSEVIATSKGTAFVNLSVPPRSLTGGPSFLFELDLTTGLTKQRTDPGLGFLEITGNALSASKDGTHAYIAVPGDSGGEVYGWSASTDTWQEHNLGVAASIYLTNGAASRDGNIFAVNNQFDISDFPYTMMVDAQLNQISQLGIASLFAPTNWPGIVVHDTGSLVYTETDSGIDLIDVHHGALAERILLNESHSSLAGTVVSDEAVDETGSKIFLITGAGLTIVDLDSVPLSIGSMTPSIGGAGTIVKLRGSGFQSGTSVTFNGTSVPSSYVDADTLQLTVPLISSGPAQVVLTNPGGESYTLDSGFTIQ